MSVWAQAWSYEQRLGKWREIRGKRSWKGDPGAKHVLAALATFADEDGYCWVGQDTLAAMTEMTDRTVREHLYNLEHGYKLIRRRHRRRRDGNYTSDGIWLLAPRHRLRPPTDRDRGEAGGDHEHAPRAEKFSAGEKRGDGRKNQPAENSAVGRKQPNRRKSLQGPAEKFSGEPSGEPLVEPSGGGGARAPAREDAPRQAAAAEKPTGKGKSRARSATARAREALSRIIREVEAGEAGHRVEPIPSARVAEYANDYEAHVGTGRDEDGVLAPALRRLVYRASSADRSPEWIKFRLAVQDVEAGWEPGDRGPAAEATDDRRARREADADSRRRQMEEVFGRGSPEAPAEPPGEAPTAEGRGEEESGYSRLLGDRPRRSRRSA